MFIALGELDSAYHEYLYTHSAGKCKSMLTLVKVLKEHIPWV